MDKLNDELYLDYSKLQSYLINQVETYGEVKVSDDISEAFYQSSEWRAKRAEIRERDNHECMLCRAKGKVTLKQIIVHHIIPLKRAYEKRLDDDNLISLCLACHNHVHSIDNFNKKNICSEWW